MNINKRFAALLLSSMLVSGLFLPAHAAELYSISQICDQTSDSWNESVTTSHGDTITVNCAVVVPNVDRLPVIQIKPMEKRSSEIESLYAADAVYEPSLNAYLDTGRHCLVFENHDGIFYYGKHGFDKYLEDYFWTNKYDYREEFLPYEEADVDMIYPENSSVSLGEAIQYYQKWIDEFFPDEQIIMRLSPVKPSTYRTAFFDKHDKHRITPCGSYELRFDQVMHGIPILLTYVQVFNQSIKSKSEEILSLGVGSGELSLSEPDVEFGIRANLCQELKVVEADIPVINFETVRDILKQEIVSGRLREITRIELGYCVYTDSKSNNFFWLVPAWVCRCRFNAGEHELLVIFGQHGSLSNAPNSRDITRCVCPEIITREDISHKNNLYL